MSLQNLSGTSKQSGIRPGMFYSTRWQDLKFEGPPKQKHLVTCGLSDRGGLDLDPEKESWTLEVNEQLSKLVH